MSKLTVNAPIQAKTLSPEQGIGKAVPIFVADWLRAHERPDGPQPTFDLWNTVLAAEQKGHNQESYQTHWQGVLQRNYESPLLADWREPQADLRIVTDQDKEFGAWVLDILERSREIGDIELLETRVVICSGCGMTRAIEGASCSRPCIWCSETATARVERPVLMTRYDEQTYDLVARSTGGLQKNSEKGLPPERIISKQRLGGIGLEAFGLEGDVLDPGVALGMLGLYCAWLAGTDGVEMITSRSAMAHNLPAFFSAIRGQVGELPDLTMRPIAKVPAGYLMYLYDQSVIDGGEVSNALRNVLPPHLLQMQRDMTPQTLDRIIFGK
jgi:hypothetical protein